MAVLNGRRFNNVPDRTIVINRTPTTSIQMAKSIGLQREDQVGDRAMTSWRPHTGDLSEISGATVAAVFQMAPTINAICITSINE